jgi:drug/metabolite transporter (DMT)-like permease
LSIKEWFKFILLSVMWGSSFFWIKISVQETTPIIVVGLRLVISVIGLTILVIANRKPDRIIVVTKKQLFSFSLLGLFNIALPFLLVTWSEQFISSALASIINSTVPLLTMVIAPIFILEERITPIRVIGMLFGFLGVLALLSPQLKDSSTANVLGVTAMFGAALSYAVSAIYARRTTEGLPADMQALLQIGFATTYVWLIILASDQTIILPHLPISWGALLWLGLLGSCLGTVIFYDLIHTIGPTRTLITNYIFPLIGVLLGVLILHETIVWQEIVGGVLILSGVIFANSFKPHQAKVISKGVQARE